jgi:two-component system, OmpR family, sensor kinase
VKLRFRLAGALALLLLIGLAIFGVATYGTYARSERNRLDDQLTSSLSLVERELLSSAGLDGSGPELPRSNTGDNDQGGDPDGGRKGKPQPVVVPVGTYAELVDSTGNLVKNLATSETGFSPQIPTDLPAEGSVVEVSDSTGVGSWRLMTRAVKSPAGFTVVVAVPTTEVDRSLRRLLNTEVAAGVALIGIVLLGSWVILRRGLQPLETMATEARNISAGALTKRVSLASPGTEVGELGLALNSMLGGIEDAFNERDATEQRLRQFLADASHELRTPLTSIQGFAEMSRIGGANVDQELVIRRIEQESARMKSLVDDLFTLARLDQTRPIDRSPVDLAVIAADSCTDARAAAPDRPIILDAPEPAIVNGDIDHLRQAIANLVANAIRHTPTGTEIAISVRRDAAFARIEVSDRGPGIAPDDLGRVFDRFWQADAARHGKGSGLGLSIVAGIAREHDGKVSVTNRPEGGATFTLSVPMPPAGLLP